jgi:hypothetical protein
LIGCVKELIVLVGDVATASGTGSSDELEQRIAFGAFTAEEQLDAFTDQLGPRSVALSCHFSQPAILAVRQVELDTYHAICMIHISVSGKRRNAMRR